MIIISHRGNLNGPDKNIENTPTAIEKALSLGFDVEIDIWHKENEFWLGHDEPQYNVDFNFIRTKGLWIHCKNLSALDVLINTNLEFFWHETDTVTLTSNNYIWTYPCKPLISHKSIAVMPELCNNYNFDLRTSLIYGVCTDYPMRYL